MLGGPIRRSILTSKQRENIIKRKDFYLTGMKMPTELRKKKDKNFEAESSCFFSSCTTATEFFFFFLDLVLNTVE